jgi:hypothetical protein
VRGHDQASEILHASPAGKEPGLGDSIEINDKDFDIAGSFANEQIGRLKVAMREPLSVQRADEKADPLCGLPQDRSFSRRVEVATVSKKGVDWSSSIEPFRREKGGSQNYVPARHDGQQRLGGRDSGSQELMTEVKIPDCP